MLRAVDGASAWKGLAAGLLAGVAGTLAMTAAQKLLGAAQQRLSSGNGQDPEQEQEQEDGHAATVEAAQRVTRRVLGRELLPSERPLAGQVVHYGFGTGVGAAYGLLAEFAPSATAGMGTAFGAGLMLAADEALVPALGLSPPPHRQPASIHAYALASHLVYGLSTEWVRRSLRARL